jgi:hypothetical protein
MVAVGFAAAVAVAGFAVAVAVAVGSIIKNQASRQPAAEGAGGLADCNCRRAVAV